MSKTAPWRDAEFWSDIRAAQRKFLTGFKSGTIAQQAREERWFDDLLHHVRRASWYQAQVAVTFDRRGIPLARLNSDHGKRVYRHVFDDFKLDALALAGEISVPITTTEIAKFKEMAVQRAALTGANPKPRKDAEIGGVRA